MIEQRNYVLQTLNECGFHDRGTTLQATSTTLELELQLCFVLPKKIRISPFPSHSLLGHSNYFLLIAQMRLMLLAEVVYQSCFQGQFTSLLSCCMLLHVVWR